MKQTKKKIIEVSTDTNIGGAGKCLITLLENFNYDIFEVKVILPPNSLLKPHIEKLGIEVIEVQGIAEKSLDLKSIRSLGKIFKREKPELVHTHASMSARIAARHAGAKVVYTRHSVFPPSKYLTHFPGKQLNLSLIHILPCSASEQESEKYDTVGKASQKDNNGREYRYSPFPCPYPVVHTRKAPQADGIPVRDHSALGIHDKVLTEVYNRLGRKNGRCV